MKMIHDQSMAIRRPRRMLRFVALGMGLVILSTALFGCGIAEPVQADTLAIPGKIKEGVRYEDVSEEFRRSLWAFADKTSASVLIAPEDQNSLYSPISLYYALAMLEAGAANKTKTDLRAFMAVPDSAQMGDELRNLYALMTVEREKTAEQIANAIWFREDLLGDTQKFIKQDWLDQLSNDFYASAFKVDFSKAETAKRMSAWVEEQTKGKIKPDIDLSNPDLLIVLMNTLYFKANWVTPFEENSIHKDTFDGANGPIIDVSYLSGFFKSLTVLREERYQACALPLMNGRIDFILPAEGTTPEDLLKDPALLVTLMEKERSLVDVDFKLPEFTYRTKMDVLEMMKSIGLQGIVSENPDFSAMLDRDAQVSAITQETFIALDKDGVEAAAYTEIQVGVGDTSVPDQLEHIQMTLDRPFIYVISDSAGAPLFVGIVRNPLSK